MTEEIIYNEYVCLFLFVFLLHKRLQQQYLFKEVTSSLMYIFSLFMCMYE